MKTANGVEVSIAEATSDLLETFTDAALSRYAASTERDISKCVDAIEVLEKAARKVIRSLEDDIERKKKQLGESQAFAYRIFVEQENR
jgi:hypothetical protein